MKLLLLVISTLCLAAFSSAASPYTGCIELGTLLTCSSTANAFEARIIQTTGTYQLVTFTGKTAATYPDNYFTGLTITTIVSQNNHITSIGDNVFTGATSVAEFSIQESDLLTITANAFTPIKSSLTKLSIISSAITPTRMNGIATGLATLSSLRTLILSGNNLLTVSSSWFTGLTALQTLDLSTNNILDTTAIFAALSPLSASLQTLTLTGNTIATVSNLPAMAALKTINLDTNQITGFSSTTPFAAAPALTSVKLNGNKLTVVPNIAGNPAILDLNMNTQTGLTTIADSAFSRNAVTNQAIVNLDSNANLKFGTKAFCSSVTPNIQEVTIAWTAAANINACHFKQFGATAAKPTNFKISKQAGVTDYTSFCTCANYAAAKAFFVTINSANTACDTLTEAACGATTFTDNCATASSGNYVCPAAPTTTSGSQTNKFDLVGFLVANVVFMFAYRQF